MYVEKYNINEDNCNPTLTHLYSERDKCSARIDKLICMGYDPAKAEAEYDFYCEVISELCNWRRSHDCKLEGDTGTYVVPIRA